MPNIKSSTDLRNGYNAISTFCHESRAPVFITKNGKGDLAVMSIEVYEELIRGRNRTLTDAFTELENRIESGSSETYPDGTRCVLDDTREELHRLLKEGEDSIKTERTIPGEEVHAGLQGELANTTSEGGIKS